MCAGILTAHPPGMIKKGVSENSPTDDDELASIDALSDGDVEPELVDDAHDVTDEVQAGASADGTPPPPPTMTRRPTEVGVDDYDFIKRVFAQVRDVDFRTPPPPPPKGLSGPDKKMHDLREKVRRLERELARVGFVWTNKQREVDAVDSIIKNKEAERQSALSRYTKLKDAATQAAAEHRAEIAEFRGNISQLESTRDSLQQQLEQVTQARDKAHIDFTARLTAEETEKATLHAEFKRKIEAAGVAFNTLRDQSTRTIASLETQLRLRDEQATKAEQELQSTKTALGQAEGTIESLRRESAAVKADLEKRVSDLEAENAKVSREIGGAQAEMRQLQELHDARGVDIERLKEKLAGALAQASAAVASAASAAAAPTASAPAVAGPEVVTPGTATSGSTSNT